MNNTHVRQLGIKSRIVNHKFFVPSSAISGSSHKSRKYSLKSNNDEVTTLAKKSEKTNYKKSVAKVVTSLFILMVEDDPIVQRVHCLMLKKLGHRVDMATNGQEALSLFNQKNYDLVLTDVGLPGMSGAEIALEIRHLKTIKKNIPIIALTGYIQEEIKNDCLKSGINIVATKPIPIDRLQKLLQCVS